MLCRWEARKWGSDRVNLRPRSRNCLRNPHATLRRACTVVQTCEISARDRRTAIAMCVECVDGADGVDFVNEQNPDRSSQSGF
jgi:hypothetical protein